MTVLRKYGVQATFLFDLFEVDGIDFRVDAAHASGDTKIMKDEGVEANTTNAFVDEGQGYSITLTATEMQFARGKVYIVDSATKAWLDTSIEIETYGHASAQHAMDFDDAVRGGMTALPNAAAEAAGGLYTRGTGAGQINQAANGQVDGNVVALGGGAQSLTDLKDFADAGYDPATNFVQSNVRALEGETGAAIRLSRFFLAGRHGLAQGGTSGTITLAAGAITDDNFLKGSAVVLSKNTGRRQFRLITGTVAATDVATIDPDWIIIPDDSTEYVVVPFGLVDAVSISGDVAAADAITEARMAALTDWLNGGRLDLLLDAIPTTAMRGTDGANTTAPDNTGITTIINDLANGTDGLGALKALIDTVNTDLSNGTDGLGALKTLIDTVNTDLSNGTDGLGALKTLIDGLNNITAAAVLAAGDIDGYTLEEAFKIALASMAGKASGLNSSTAIYRAADDSKPRITATVDADGNRSAVTLDAAG